MKALDSLTYEFLRPNWNPDVCSTNTAVTDRGKGCPVSDPAIREAIRWAVNKDEINSRLLGGAAALGFTNVSPERVVLQRPADLHLRSREGEVGPRCGRLDRRQRRDPREERRQGEDRALHDHPPGPPGHAGPGLELPEGRRDRLGGQRRVVDRHLREPTTGPRTRRRAPCPSGNYDLAEHAFSVPLDPLSNYPTYHSSQIEPNGGNDAHEGPRRRLDPRRRQGHGRLRQDQGPDGQWQKVYVEKTIEIPLYFRKEVYLVRPEGRELHREPDLQGPRGTRTTGASPSSDSFEPEATRAQARIARIDSGRRRRLASRVVSDYSPEIRCREGARCNTFKGRRSER